MIKKKFLGLSLKITEIKNFREPYWNLEHELDDLASSNGCKQEWSVSDTLKK
jgi:hypothetical protein